MKKFRVKDEDGNDYTVEEMIEEKSTEDEDVVELTSEEVASLRKLLPHIDKIISIVSEKVEDSDEEKLEDSDEDDITEDEDEELEDDDFEEEKEEEIVDTDEEIEDEDIDEKEKVHDSKVSAASIKRKHKAKNNDAIDSQLEIVNAWAKRYQGGND